MNVEIHGWPKSAVGVAEQDANAAVAERAAKEIADGEIEFSVSIEVRCRDCFRVGFDGIKHRGVESSVALIDQNAEVKASDVCNRQIGFVIAIEVSSYCRVGIGADWIGDVRRKRLRIRRG